MNKEEIIKQFRDGHKGEEMMEIAEAEAELEIALQQAEEKGWKDGYLNGYCNACQELKKRKKLK